MRLTHANHENCPQKMYYAGPQHIVQSLIAAWGNRSVHRSVLDLGCGTGLVGEAIRDVFQNTYLVGVESSQQKLRQASSKYVYDVLMKANLFDGSLSHKLMEDAPFDAIVCIGAFEYLGRESFEQFLADIKHLIGDHTIIVMGFPTYIYTLRSIELACKRHGLKLRADIPTLEYPAYMEGEEEIMVYYFQPTFQRQIP